MPKLLQATKIATPRRAIRKPSKSEAPLLAPSADSKNIPFVAVAELGLESSFGLAGLLPLIALV